MSIIMIFESVRFSMNEKFETCNRPPFFDSKRTDLPIIVDLILKLTNIAF